MSYPPPYQPASQTHPYPPQMSYPSAPGFPGNPSGYPQQSTGYSPYPQSNPQYPGGAPYPGGASYPQSGTSPYPQSGASPYPPSGTSPYPATGTSPYPATGTSPYPASGTSPYPASGTSPYPPSGASPYPPGSSPTYPLTPGNQPPGNIAHSSVYQGTYPPGTVPITAQHQQPLTSYPPSNAAPGYPGAGGSLYPALGTPAGHGGHHAMVHHQAPKRNPTLLPHSPFNPRSDAEVLRKAMKGFGTDEAALISVLSRRTNQQRQEISRQYKSLYGKDLVKDLKGETSGNFEELLVALMTPTHEFLAKELNRATAGLGTQEQVLIEVMCTLNNNEVQAIKSTYERMFRKSLEKDIISDTFGNFKRLMVSLCTGRRDESPYVDQQAAATDARALYQAGEKKLGTDESTFNAILVTRSFPQLVAIFDEYQKLAGNPMERAIKSEFSGYIEDGLLAIVQCARSKPGYLAECLHDSMSGLGTKDRTLIRIMATRCEIDMADIKQQFQSKYGKSLDSKIKSDTSGDYRKLLIALQS